MPAIQGIQILLGVVIVTLTALLIFVGIQVVFILREVRGAVKKINQALGNKLTRSPKHANIPISVRTFLEYLLLGQPKVEPPKYTTISENQTDDVVEAESIEDSFKHITALQEKGRRVFHREGKPLA